MNTRWRSRTRLYASIIDGYMLPAMGRLRVKDVTNRDVAKLHKSMERTPYHANRTLTVISIFFNWCEGYGYRERGSNPCQGVIKYKEQLRKIFMGEAELSRLAEAMERLERAGRVNKIG